MYTFIVLHYSSLWMILIQERKKINQQQQPSWGETSSHIFCHTHQHNKRQNKAAILCCCNLKSNNFHHHPCHLTKKHWHKSNDDKDKWVTFSANHTVFCLLMFSIWNGWQKQGNREVIKLDVLHIICHLLNVILSKKH